MCQHVPLTRLGDYLLLQTIGAGSTGKVKLAQHVPTGDLVALKLVRHSHLHRNTAQYTKLIREVAIMKYLSAVSRQLVRDVTHIGVLQLRDVHLFDDDMIVLVLDYCQGGELFDVIVDQGYIPAHTALDYFQQLVHALEFCHRRGICHRDIKLDNVLISADGRLKLADFGMSCLYFPQSLLQTACGSPHYCAPEMLNEELYNGYAADIWSLGVVLFTMITGGLPFDDDNISRLMTKIRTASFYIPRQVPDDIAHLIQRMLDPDPNTRITLGEIKQTVWFKSQPVRSDIFIETPPSVVNDDNKNNKNNNTSTTNSIISDTPTVVDDPDIDIVTQLAHLGLGDIPTICRRLKHFEPCKEKDFYHVLAQYDRLQQQQKHHAPDADDTCIDKAFAVLSVDDDIVRNALPYGF